MEIQIAGKDQADDILRLYSHYVRNSVATFEEEPPSLIEMKQRIASVNQNHIWLCLYHARKLAGYAYASAHRQRSAYRYSLETSIYLDPAYQGKQLSKPFYQLLLFAVREMGYQTAFAGVSMPNPASVKLHQALGFEKIGTFKGVGYKFNKWIDTFWMQLRLRDDEEIPQSCKKKEELFLSENWRNRQKYTEELLMRLVSE